MAFKWSFSKFQRGSRDFYVSLCLTAQLYCGLMLSERYTVKFVGVQGPSMLPTLDTQDNLVLLDCFTPRLVRKPRVGEVVMAENPFKPGYTIVKRVLYTEGQMAEFWSYEREETLKVEVPPGHIWVEGDNKENSKDSRSFGPLPLVLVDGIVRARIWPFDKVNQL